MIMRASPSCRPTSRLRSRRWMRISAAAACVVCVGSLAVRVGAFKPKTHIWIGQQVLNDVLPDGKVSIPPFGEFDVPTEVWDALRAHRKEYLMGLVGPDGFPDPLVGQTTVHPGEPIKNDEWLKFLLERPNSPAARAFVHGFLAHAASDIAAHSWVNLYSGDYFELKDGQEEEIRHIALEDHVARATPALRDHSNADLGPSRRRRCAS